MKLSLKDAKKIADSHSLGKVIDIKPINEGLSNYNFDLTSKEGDFIIRFSSFKSNKTQLDRLKLQTEAISFLNGRGFEYKIPVPIRNKKGSFISKIDDKYYWVYRKVAGEVYSDIKKMDIKQLAELIAKYHKIMRNFPLKKTTAGFYGESGLKEGLLEIKNKLNNEKVKDDIDLYMQKNLDIFEKAIKRVPTINYGKEVTIAHSDWYIGNVIYNKDKIIGLIDFDLFEITTYLKDIACAIQLYCFTKDNKWDKKAAEEFIKEYEKFSPLEKFDKYHLKDLIIRESCYGVLVFYLKNKKVNEKKRLFMLNWFLSSIKNLMEDIENKDYY